MAIAVKLDDLLHDRRMTLTELADRIGMTLANLSILKTGKARAIRFSTLDAICEALSCQPGDILRFVWASGFGLANVAGKGSDDTPDEVPDGVAQQAVHGHGRHAVARAGRLRLDDPVSKHLPWFTVTSRERGRPAHHHRELLTHSSGLPREAADHWTTFDFPTREELKTLMPKRQAPFLPRLRWKYSNLAYTLAGWSSRR